MAETVTLPSNPAPIANTGIAGGIKPQPVGGGTANQYVNGVRSVSYTHLTLPTNREV